MSESVEELREEVEALKQRLAEAEDWSDGIQMVLQNLLPFLLRGHPEIEKIQGLMKSASERFESGAADPDGPPLGAYEPSKMLYRQLAILGVWPGVDSETFVEEAIGRRQCSAD
jgi:hypothetical protein